MSRASASRPGIDVTHGPYGLCSCCLLGRGDRVCRRVDHRPPCRVPLYSVEPEYPMSSGGRATNHGPGGALATATCPVVVLAGELDPVCPVPRTESLDGFHSALRLRRTNATTWNCCTLDGSDAPRCQPPSADSRHVRSRGGNCPLSRGHNVLWHRPRGAGAGRLARPSPRNVPTAGV